MSRIGKLPVTLPSGTTAEVRDGRIFVKGKKGSLDMAMPAGIELQQEGTTAHLVRESDDRQVRANHGLARALFANLVKGVSEGFERRLEIQGVGYSAEIKGGNLQLNLGYSHPILYTAPEGVSVSLDGNTRIVVQGIDKQKVGQAAATIRSFRAPDSYKGKGVRYKGENVRIKAGKSAA